jgi:hypothetical protein
MPDLNEALRYALQSDPMMGLSPEQSASLLNFFASKYAPPQELLPASFQPQPQPSFKPQPSFQLPTLQQPEQAQQLAP